MSGRTLSIGGAVLAVLIVLAHTLVNNPANPVTTSSTQATQQVASADNDFTDSSVLGSTTPETTPPPNNQTQPAPRLPQNKTNRAITPFLKPVRALTPIVKESLPNTLEKCDPNYVPCVPLVSNDLSCSEIGFAVTVKGDDRHGFDDDSNGTGCEEYRRVQEVEEEELVILPQPEIFVNGVNCDTDAGDTYPARWCAPEQDSVIDLWGMLNRESVSYAAWKVAESGRTMPTGFGNAKQWDDDARGAGIQVDTTPEAGDVAVSNFGFFGHVMYVESVNPSGSINISQYNYLLDGAYSRIFNMPKTNLVFIHF